MVHLLPVSSRASINSDSDDSGFSPSEELAFPCTEEEKAGRFTERGRRFSSICSVRDHFRDISIPEVVVTSHDDEEVLDCRVNLSERRRTLVRSLSSPGMVSPTLTSSNIEQNNFRNHHFSVTLEDVEKFKVMRKISGGSNFDDRSSLTFENKIPSVGSSFPTNTIRISVQLLLVRLIETVSF